MPVRVEIIPQMPVTAIGKIFKPRLRHLAIERVCGELLQANGIEASVAVRDDKRLGTVAAIRLVDAAMRDLSCFGDVSMPSGSLIARSVEVDWKRSSLTDS